MKLFSLKTLVAALVGMGVSATTANAGIISINDVKPVASLTTPGDSVYSYTVVLQSDSQLHTGNYFTIYDFAGFVSASIPAGWQMVAAKTPEDVKPVFDKPDVPNYTFQYTGADVKDGMDTLGSFNLESIYGSRTRSSFASRDFNKNLGFEIGTHTYTYVPLKPEDSNGGGGTDTPEPATLALVGLGLPVVGLARAIRKRRETAADAS